MSLLMKNLEEQFEQMMLSCGLKDCPQEQREDMHRAFCGGALVVAKTIGSNPEIWEVAKYTFDNGLLDRMPNISPT